MLERVLLPNHNPMARRAILAALALAIMFALAGVALHWSDITVDYLLLACMAVPIAVGYVDFACALAATAVAVSIVAFGPWR